MNLNIVREDGLREMSVDELRQLKKEYWAYAEGNELPEMVPWIVDHLGKDGHYIETDFALSIHWNRENRQWSVYYAGRLVITEGTFVPGSWLDRMKELYTEASRIAVAARRHRLEAERQKLIEQLRPA